MSIRAATETTNLGRYHVVKRLAAGGMADVLLARTVGISGFERHVVIKRIHAELGDEPRYRKMFLDEARLAASLHHANIVQVNDIGEEDGEYFFAMEYVHGEDARTLLINATERGEKIPIEHVVTIVMAAASGLHHAHDQLGPDRTPLHIVHRDVSPANILVGYDGGVKVADFGIAQAAQRAESTQSGVLKGKASYMSPEQCNSDPIDRRSDVFSLGIVLYELATVHPCFRGDNDFMTMTAIVNGRREPARVLNPSIPVELDAIISKALSTRREDRYATCDEMRRALEEFADAEGMRSSTSALADYMKKQFGTRPEPWLVAVEPDAEIEISGSSTLELELVLKMPQQEPEDDLSVPVEQVEPGMKPIKTTLPMRALRLVPAARSVAGTLNSPTVAPPSAVPSAPRGLPLPAPELTPLPVFAGWRQAVPTKNAWLAIGIFAFLAALLAFMLVRHTTPSSVATPSIAPREDVELRYNETQRTNRAPAAAPAVAPTTPAQPAGKSAVKQKWDPDALFPN